MKKVFFLAEGLMNWSGGVDFFLSNAVALLSLPRKNEITFVFPPGKFLTKWERIFFTFLKKRVIKRNEILSTLYAIEPNLSLVFWKSGKKRLATQLQKKQADLALFARGEYHIPCPSVGYIPDLQHRYLPHFFSEEEKSFREESFRKHLTLRDLVIVSSREVREDLAKIYPHGEKLRCISYRPFLLDDSYLAPLPYSVREKYGIHFSYFMICNQFWVHKDHKTAFLALQKLREEHPEIHLVCTGKLEDYRFPLFYKELLEEIEKRGLKPFIHILGYLPKREQVELMKSAIAIVQPTLFEGGSGGGATQMALALGRRVICSDIAANLEIVHENISFFQTKSVDDLVEKMKEHLLHPPPEESLELLLQKSEENKKAYGEALFAVIDEAK